MEKVKIKKLVDFFGILKKPFFEFYLTSLCCIKDDKHVWSHALLNEGIIST